MLIVWLPKKTVAFWHFQNIALFYTARHWLNQLFEFGAGLSVFRPMEDKGCYKLCVYIYIQLYLVIPSGLKVTLNQLNTSVQLNIFN